MAPHTHKPPPAERKMMSLRAYAVHRGCNPGVVSNAIATGRLGDAATKNDLNGEWVINVEAADRNWKENTRPLANRRAAQERTEDFAADDGGEDETSANYFKARALREAAAARTEAAKADIAELDLAKRQGELVDAAEARAAVVDAFTRTKTHLLGVGSKLRQRCPHLDPADVRVVTELIREALEQLADAEGDPE